MALARALLLALTAFLLAFGGAARAMPVGEPPCHEAPAHKPDPAKATLAISCCVGCMPAAQGLEPPVDLVRAAATARYRIVALTLSGLALEPEPRPPRA
jgi:hypothetical protein